MHLRSCTNGNQTVGASSEAAQRVQKPPLHVSLPHAYLQIVWNLVMQGLEEWHEDNS